jgi:hypothetical protein
MAPRISTPALDGKPLPFLAPPHRYSGATPKYSKATPYRFPAEGKHYGAIPEYFGAAS